MTRWEVTKAVRASDLPSSSRLIMFTLADVAEVGTAEIPAKFTPSLTVLAAETGLDKSTVKRHLSSLEAAGWIIRTRPDTKAQWEGERTRYRLTLPRGVEPPVGAEIPQGEGTVPPGVGAQSPEGGRTVRHLDTDHSDLDQIFSDHSPPAAPPKASKTTKRTADDDSDFAAFWKAYPRKTDKGHARTAWASALKTAEPAAIASGAELFAAQCARNRTEKRFIPHPATWLRGERWADEIDAAPTSRPNGHQPYRNPEDMSVYEEGL